MEQELEEVYVETMRPGPPIISYELDFPCRTLGGGRRRTHCVPAGHRQWEGGPTRIILSDIGAHGINSLAGRTSEVFVWLSGYRVRFPSLLVFLRVSFCSGPA